LIYFIAKTPLWQTGVLILLAGLCFFFLIKISPYRSSRISIFFNPTRDPLGAGYQLKQALIAVGSGGLFGKGLGLSQQKLGFLPQVLGDSIFAIFAEETGFFGALFLIFLFLIFLWRGLKIAKSSSELFFKLLAFGITSQIVVQAFINIGALIGILPLTGIPLPFISYGSSHLLAELIGVGILLNISRTN
jgi:cell division protein FtsW